MQEKFRDIEGLIGDFERLNPDAVMVLVYLRFLGRMTARNDKKEREAYWVHCSYETIMQKCKINSRRKVREALIPLVENGWIADMRRGHYDKSRNEGVANRYLIPVERLADPNPVLYQWFVLKEAIEKN